MKDNQLFDAFAGIDEEIADRALRSYSGSNKKNSRNHLRWIPVSVCVLLIAALAAVAGVFAYSEAKAFDAASAFFENNGLNSEGLSRTEMKNVFFDIIEKRFTDEKTAEVIKNSVPCEEIGNAEMTPEMLEDIWNRYVLQPRETDSGAIPPELTKLIGENAFKDAKAFSDRLLKSETVEKDPETRTVVQKVTMLDIFGDVLAEYTVKCDDAYIATTLTATSDGGFLFVLGFQDYTYDYLNQKRASDEGYASRVIKCDRSGNLQFDKAFDGLEGSSFYNCIEREGRYFFFGTHRDQQKWRDYGETDVIMIILADDGQEIKRGFLRGSDFDHLNYAKPSEGGFMLFVRTQSTDGDFVDSGITLLAVDMNVEIDYDLNVLGSTVSDNRFRNESLVGIINGSFFFSNDSRFQDFDAGTPTAFIDYGEYRLIVSEYVKSVYDKGPFSNSIGFNVETVYSGYDENGNLIFRIGKDAGKR